MSELRHRGPSQEQPPFRRLDTMDSPSFGVQQPHVDEEEEFTSFVQRYQAALWAAAQKVIGQPGLVGRSFAVLVFAYL